MPSDGSDSDGSDIKIQSALLKTANKKISTSPTHYLLKKQQDKKLTTKIMILEALVDLKSRKGVSLYAIKKYMASKHNVDPDKLNYYIKKFIKSAVEKGTIIQTKGVGATGSFKLVPVKEKKPKAKKTKKEKAEKTEKKKDVEKKKTKEKSKKSDGKKLKPKAKSEESKANKQVKEKKKMEAEKKPKEKKDGGEKVKKVRIAKNMQTPMKKKGMMRRKSIGSIIKQPKMKPSAKA